MPTSCGSAGLLHCGPGHSAAAVAKLEAQGDAAASLNAQQCCVCKY